MADTREYRSENPIFEPLYLKTVEDNEEFQKSMIIDSELDSNKRGILKDFNEYIRLYASIRCNIEDC